MAQNPSAEQPNAEATAATPQPEGVAPKVSVIVPVYNAQKGLQRCVDSILNQEFQDLELILVDDGSTDESPALCDTFAMRDPRVRVIHKENSGVSDTRNRGMDAARGTYVQFLDSDDWITPDATKLLVRSMEDYDVDMVIADFYRVVGSRIARKSDIDGEGVITREEYADLMLESPSDFYWGVVWNKLFRRQILEDHHVRMDPSISWCEDFIFNMEYVLHTSSIYPLHVPIYYYEKTRGSLATQGASLANTIRMKLNVIEYYKSFYQQILDQQDYEARRPDIYRFYVDSASDGGVLPGPLSTKLGSERVVACVDPDMQPNPLARGYLEGKLLDRYLDTAATAHDLDLTDARVLLYLGRCGTPGPWREIAEYTGRTTGQVQRSVGKLRSKGLVRAGLVPPSGSVAAADEGASGPDDAPERKPSRADRKAERAKERKTQNLVLTMDATPVMESIAQALADYDSARCSLMNEDERDAFRDAQRKEDDALQTAFS